MHPASSRPGSDISTHQTSESPAKASIARDWLLLAGFCAYLFFFGLGFFGLIGADEPRYAQIAREMLARHDCITPILGGLPWLEKPVLYYWQAMISYSVFGVSDWAARIPSAVDATLMVLAVYLFLRRFRPGFHLDSALITASLAGVIGFGRAASTDMPLSALLTIGLLGWYGWFECGGKRYLAAFYIFVALAMLAKGPVAPFLAAAIIVIFAAAKGDYGLVLRTLWIPGVLLFCALALPWYVGVQLRNPDFFRIFILQHNLERFGTNLYHHREPFWYYLLVTLLGLVPWIVFVLVAFGETMRACWSEKRALFASEDALAAFLVIWLLFPVVFFSFSQSKLPGYILPALPAGAILLTEYIRRHVSAKDGPSPALSIMHGVVAALPIVPALMLQYIIFQGRLPWDTAAEVATGLAVVLAAGIAWTLHSQYGLRVLRFVTLIPVVLAVAAILKIGAPALDAKLSARPVANEISHIETQPLPVAVFHVSRETEYGLAFYQNQIIDRYERGEIPKGEHVVVAPAGSRDQLARRIPGRRIAYLGNYPAQKLEFYWVAESSN